MSSGILLLPPDRAREYINMLGHDANIQFLDMNTKLAAPQRQYKHTVHRLDEMERIIRFLLEELSHVDADVVKNNVPGFLATEAGYVFEEVEKDLLRLNAEFVNMKKNNEKLLEARNKAVEARCVAQAACKSFQNSHAARRQDDASARLLEGVPASREGMAFSNVAGTINVADKSRFQRFLFRMSRGNTFCMFEPIDEVLRDPASNKEVSKAVFVVYYQDVRGLSGGSNMEQKILNACTAFGVNQYDWPTSYEEATMRLQQLDEAVSENNRTMKAFEGMVLSTAQELLAVQRGGNSKIEEWRMFCAKEKALFHTLNMFEAGSHLRCECWYPEEEELNIRHKLVSLERPGQAGATLLPHTKSAKHAPTYFRENDFTFAFQEIIHTYGVPRYKEASPVLFSCVTFPFIFGIMYGDVGHGTILMLAGLYMVINADSLRYTNPSMYMARYLVCFMAFFAIYAGFMYNDMFSLGIDLFGTRWVETKCGGTDSNSECFKADYDTRNSASGERGPYPFGIDPTWHGATNELLYMNSLKMKLSVIVGVVQMTVGVLLRFSNAIHDRSMVDLFCECCPMLIFMVCFFGYMDFMIMFKWVTPACDKDHPIEPCMQAPPSIINSLICMIMGTPDPNPLWDTSIEFQKTLLFWIFVSVPWLLIPKPVILYLKNKSASRGHEGHVPLRDEDKGGHDDHEEFAIGEVVIHQAIETIEYVLGTVSHTASYLRQWALSLAHQQLALVFFQKTLTGALESESPMNGLFIFFGFAAWFWITMGVLLGMDVLECFLHTLRLHWVEFDSKFYKADGYAFQPFRHERTLAPSS
jgi:V-type H+-transporting ATPase subunit a